MTTSDAGTLVAITHVPSPNMQRGERTFVDHVAVDYELALRQHAAYRSALQRCGAEVIVLDVNRTMPDCVFVEDTAIVLRELAVMMSPGAESRRAEPAGIEPALREFREVRRVKRPATIDGGDVVVAGRSVYVGDSPRTNTRRHCRATRNARAVWILCDGNSVQRLPSSKNSLQRAARWAVSRERRLD